MKKLIVGLLVCLGVRLAGASPYFDHVDYTSEAGVQGQLVSGAVRTNAGIGSVQLLPIFYHNAPTPTTLSQFFTDLSFSPLAIGGSFGGGNGQFDLGPIFDLGPQVQGLIVAGLKLASPSASQKVLNFFAPNGNYVALSAGVLLNASPLINGRIIDPFSKEGLRSPLGFFAGPSVIFGPKAKAQVAYYETGKEDIEP